MKEPKATPRKREATTILGTLNRSVKAATWLTPADEATVTLARRLASALDRGELSPQLVARLLDVLKALGLTAISRKDLEPDKERKEGSALALVRTLAPAAGRVSPAPRLHAVKK